MELDKRTGPLRESFWKSVLADFENVGLLRGRSPQTSDRLPNFDGQCVLSFGGFEALQLKVDAETVLRAAWAIVLSRHTGSSDVVFLSSFHEKRPWLAPIRVAISPEVTVLEWIAGFDAWLAEAEKRGPVPSHLMASPKEAGPWPSLPTFLVIPPGASAFPPREQIRGPLLVVVRLDISKIEIHYDTEWFDEADVQALGDHFNIVLEAMTAAPSTAVGRLPLLTEAERTLLLDEWNKTTVPFADSKCVHQFFEEQAARIPDETALFYRGREWTYAELNAQAERVAQRLRAEGVGPGTFVAICLHRSLELMAALLGVLKAGGAYVPLDPAYPVERLVFMVEDAQPAVTIVSEQTAGLFADRVKRLFRIEDQSEATPKNGLAPAEPKSADPAYVLYTSGSTGKPKGVVITHRNVSNFFTAMDGVIGTDPGVWLAVTSVNFDISVFELFWTLARGFRVILQEEGQWVSQGDSRFALPQQLLWHAVTHFQCTPSLAAMLISDAESHNAIKGLRRFLVGGEPLPLDLARRISDNIAGDLINLYGPTETTVWSASQLIRRGETQIVIGRPVANNRLYVLDAQRELAPIGSVGELYIGGEGLAREYLNRPDITQERFIVHTFAPGRTERLYRTGDLVRYLRDGRIEFIGRVDQQIKIRGVRVELGEIEVALREHPEVRDAVVVVQEVAADDKRLVAYIVPSTAQTPAPTQVQQWLGGKLPKAIVPSAYVFLAEFPKTPNGKLDRRALPKPDQKPMPKLDGVGNALEREIAAIWSEALGIPSVGLDQRFFDIGGHSLLMIEVHDRIRDRTGHTVPLLDLFQYPTIRSLAQHLGRSRDEVAARTTGLSRGRLRQQLTARQGALRQGVPANHS